MPESNGQAVSSIVVYGHPPADLADVPAEAMQLSPLVPGSASLEALADASLDGVTILAPPGTVERRFALAHLLRAARPDAEFVALGSNDKGGRRIAAELEGFGCTVETESRKHHRIAHARRPERMEGIEEAIAAGSPYRDAATGLWTQAGVFSFDRVDPGSALLLAHLPALGGRGADLGCGIGVLSREVLKSEAVSKLFAVEIDRRAVEAAKRNVPDERAAIRWADAREPAPDMADLDFVVTNPPFHDGGGEDRALGQDFIRRAGAMLRRGGALWLVANRHLPYEAVLKERFARAAVVAESGGYKLFEARR